MVVSVDTEGDLLRPVRTMQCTINLAARAAVRSTRKPRTQANQSEAVSAVGGSAGEKEQGPRMDLTGAGSQAPPSPLSHVGLSMLSLSARKLINYLIEYDLIAPGARQPTGERSCRRPTRAGGARVWGACRDRMDGYHDIRAGR